MTIQPTTQPNTTWTVRVLTENTNLRRVEEFTHEVSYPEITADCELILRDSDRRPVACYAKGAWLSAAKKVTVTAPEVTS